MRKLEKGDKKTASAFYKMICDLAELLEQYAPSLEFDDCQECIKHCLSIFNGFMPEGYNKEIQWDAVPSM